ncbi:hypothetical protein DPEC_G00305980 [Dallia pectoralis]|uniref:Uncharacterized protein n=1 Tax=Dallia pectoralis TaxID=75939 RepID=A0ACC2FDY9_DALPE|nr:hypothetical protein DPEC_G00305980 [Dallia pectoralis]
MSTRSAPTSDMRVVLLGGRNSGKSAVGNVLLGKEEFVTNERTTCSRRVGEVAGRWVTVVDTPGWWCDFTVQETPELVRREIVRSVSLCHPGPHVFLVVVKKSSVFCEKRRRALEGHLALFGERVWSHCLVIFAGIAWPGHTPVELGVKSGAPLWLVEKCSNRYHCLDTKSSKVGNQVTELFWMMQRLLTENRENYFKMEETLLQDIEEKKKTAEQKSQQRLISVQKQRSRLKGDSCSLSDIRLVLCGAKGSGKSSAGNTILGGKVFDVKSRTARCVMKAGSVSGRRVTVVDTPGWWMNYFRQDSTVFDQREIAGGVSLCPPGPHAILLAVRVDRFFTETYRRAVQEHLELITDAIWAHTVVLFNYGDWLGDTTVEQHIESEGAALQWIVEKCHNRYHVLNNRSNSGFQVSELMKKIEDLVACNAGCVCAVEDGVLWKLEEWKREVEEAAALRLMRSQKRRETDRSLLGQLHSPVSDLRIALLGGSNAGKSSAGNTILGRKRFDVGNHETVFVEGQEEIKGRTVLVVESPGWWSVGSGYLESPADSGATVLLVVVNVSSSYTPTLRSTAEECLQGLGEEQHRRTMVLFTFGNWLGDTSIEQRIESEGEALQSLVERCGNRYHVLDNKSQDTGAQVTELLEKIEEMLAEERLKTLQRGEQVGKSLTAIKDQGMDELIIGEKDKDDSGANHLEVPTHHESEVARSNQYAQKALEIAERVLAQPEARSGEKTRVNRSILDVQRFLLSMAIVFQSHQKELRWNMDGGRTLVVNLPDWLQIAFSPSHHGRQNGQKAMNTVSNFFPGRQAVPLQIPGEQPEEPLRVLVEPENIMNVQSPARHSGTLLKDTGRTGDQQTLIDQWGNSNLEELESFIDSYFETVWKETMGSFNVEKEDYLTRNSPELGNVAQDSVDVGSQDILSSIEKKLSKLDILDCVQRDLLELRQSLDRSCSLIQELSEKSKATRGSAVTSGKGQADGEDRDQSDVQ